MLIRAIRSLRLLPGEDSTERAASGFAIRLALTVLVAVFIPTLLGVTLAKSFTNAEQIFLGLLIFLAGATVQLGFSLAVLSEKHSEAGSLMVVRNEVDVHLVNIRASMDRLVQHGVTLYTDYYKRELLRLEQALLQTSTKYELPVWQDSDTTDMMLRGMSGTDQDVCRFVHYLSDNDFLHDVHAREFFYDVSALVASGRVRRVERLFIWSEQADLDDPRTVRLLQFHHKTPGFAAKLIRQVDYDKVRRDFGFDGEKLDIGIYGSQYLYRAITTTSTEVRGVFIAQPAAVKQHILFFDRCWASGLSKPGDFPKRPMTLEKLFDV